MHWYLMDDGPHEGARNMATDTHLLHRAEREGCGVLRLYHWTRPTLTVGRNQRLAGQVDREACEAEGIPVVRRPTGGWAVLHGHDLTYAVAAPSGGGALGESILSTYRALAGVFVHLFRGLGHEPALQAHTGRQRLERASAICFAMPSAYEILVDGRKLVGSAQRRRPGAFLQHGSIPYGPQEALLARVFPGATPASVRATMTDLARLGVWERLDEAGFRRRLAAAFSEVMGCRLAPLPWGPADADAVEALAADYAPVPPDLPAPPAARAAPASPARQP